jgi:hypothetical protein
MKELQLSHDRILSFNSFYMCRKYWSGLYKNCENVVLCALKYVKMAPKSFHFTLHGSLFMLYMTVHNVMLDMLT